jgi:tetratricopeptide (TPR) repeat protein
MDYTALCLFNTLNSEPRFNAALDDLQVRGLLERDLEHNRYDLHPIVRHYCYDRLNDKSGIHTRLREYFAAVPTPQEDAVRRVEDLAPVIELHHHTVCSGRYDEACDLFYDRIWQLLFYRFGAYDLALELLRALFPDGEDQPARLMHRKTQAWALNELANSYSQVGQIGRAITLFNDYIVISVEQHDKTEQITGLKNIAVQQMHFGELTSALGNLRRAMELAVEVGREVQEADGHLELGRLLAVLGEFANGYAELRKGQLVFDQIGPARTNWVSVGPAYLAWTALLAGDLQTALKAAHQARVSADEVARSMYPHERDFARAEWILGAVLLMQGADLETSALHLEDALTRCRRINLVELEPSILLWSAWWHRKRGNRQDATSRAEEALTIADRCNYRLNQAEIHNFLSRLALDKGDHATARQHAEVAKERAWCDGPPHCYKPALDEAERMLSLLAAKESAN